MRTVEDAAAIVGTITVVQIETWIEASWVRPERGARGWNFSDVDIARLRLIRELHVDLGVDREALPVVLSLLDQVYDLRRRMRALSEAVGDQPEDVRKIILERYRVQIGGAKGPLVSPPSVPEPD